MNDAIIEIRGLNKTYRGGFQALSRVDLQIQRGEIFALLGPNGAGKTTLISVVCGLVNPSEGQVLVDGFDNVADYRQARERIGLVPQELTNEAFETVWNTVSFSRGLFGKAPNPAHIESVLKSLALWDKRNNRLITLSGGMKRRVLIAKALSHEPRILFLDEPTAGVDVELRREMWQVVRELRDNGVTIILTTHYIEEAEEMADRIGVINNGEIVLVEDKDALMSKLGSKQLTLYLNEPLDSLPSSLDHHALNLSTDGDALVYTYDGHQEEDGHGIPALLTVLEREGITFKDLHTRQSSLEDIFVDLVKERT
ncbi:ABC transporter ATP-binding protein [Vreelandella gomseomensis]|uniref:ABC transporter ATP-binding protein n=1 Tax=Vreelandella gomseomensis TaxID=370766 RepID=A0ABU1GGT8_9GAMM|nr:ABC transporter ATP-binding protein [Halomonas gomseomensis]MDR5876210.1 ABC transporter ATP-binding protein [Halomonas gomseomensis]